MATFGTCRAHPFFSLEWFALHADAEGAPPALDGEHVLLQVVNGRLDVVAEPVEPAGFPLVCISGVSPGPVCERVDDCCRECGRIALVITDVIMPGMNGRDLYHELSEKIPNLRVLYMSGYTDEVLGPSGVVEGAFEFIQKPFSPKVLGARVRELLDN